MHSRYEELDSLRGIAAMSVFLSHISGVKKIMFLSILTSSYFPLNMFFNGGSSVIFFFILSGFVLFIPYSRGKQQVYGEFIIKRIFRIYIPYLAAIVISIILCLLFSKGGIKDLSVWFNGMWRNPLTLKVVFDHLTLIGNYNSSQFNNVIWSLIQEMRISLVFPFLALFIKRFDWKGPLFICLCLSILSGLNNQFYWQESYGYRTSIFSTFEYMSMFIIGGLCAKYLKEIVQFYNNLSFIMKGLFLLVAYLSFNYNGMMIMVADFFRIYSFEGIMSDYAVALGSILIIIITLSTNRVKNFLLASPLRFIGKVSYSLYLYHLPILFSLIYIFYRIIPLWLIYIVAIPLALLIANLAWTFIEKPSMHWGKIITNKAKASFIKRRVS